MQSQLGSLAYWPIAIRRLKPTEQRHGPKPESLRDGFGFESVAPQDPQVTLQGGECRFEVHASTLGTISQLQQLFHSAA